MTRLREQSDAVRPSAPDPVDAWLDLLVSMLSTPKSERQRVRDELEDHLRSRVDDLLIHGLTEAAALQKAVAELGETADLARQLSHAHRPPRTRRYAMNALLIALTGTVVALGVSVVGPTAPPAAVPVAVQEAGPTTAASAPTEEGMEFGSELLAITAEVPVGRSVSFHEVMAPFADRLGLTLEIDQTALAQRGLTPAEQVMFPNTPGPRTMRAALDAITRALPVAEWHKYGEADRVVAAKFGDRLVVTTRRGLDVRTTTRAVYSLERFAGLLGDERPSFESIADTVSNHVSPTDWTHRGGKVASLSALGSSVIVTAPARIHAEFASLLDELHAQSVEQAAEREAADAALREAAAAEHRKLLDRVRIEYDRAVHQQTSEAERIERIRGEIFRAQVARANAKDDEIDRIQSELSDAAAELKRREISLEEAAARVEYLRARMIELEYEPLIRTRDAEAPVNPHVPPRVIEVRGHVHRAGMYDFKPGKTIGQMVIAAGGLSQPTGELQLVRNGTVLHQWTLHEALATPVKDTRVLPGDIIAVVD